VYSKNSVGRVEHLHWKGPQKNNSYRKKSLSEFSKQDSPAEHRPQSFFPSFENEGALVLLTNLPAADTEKEAEDIALLLLLELFEVLKGAHFV